MELTKGQAEFVNQMARKLLVNWCLTALTQTEPLRVTDDVFSRYARDKKWISDVGLPGDGIVEIRILSAGWDTAARFLKR